MPYSDTQHMARCPLKHKKQPHSDLIVRVGLIS